MYVLKGVSRFKHGSECMYIKLATVRLQCAKHGSGRGEGKKAGREGGKMKDVYNGVLYC